ncbi:HNH endonuclease [Tsukamurella asaccharolytica]|uniref:HNH endonuclease n=1 Tax=Tsukamurella asaccharolytica TaxID=2592067 RepID=UPI001E2E9211|nr:HNH endonuclease signature motif containing protein [Tsukamurella asaccharolytica]
MLVVIVTVVSFIVKQLPAVLTLAAITAAIYLTYRTIRHIRMKRYFGSEPFQARKAQLSGVVAEHNDISDYVADIRRTGSFQLGGATTGQHAHLAQFQNTSRHKYKRDRNTADYGATNVHNCSLQVVRNASSDPLKYVMKYFNIKADEQHLARVEDLGRDIGRLEGALANLQRREQEITKSFNPPAFIIKHYADEFMTQVGVTLSPIEVPYPRYVFEYVSAGGNSSQRTVVDMHGQAIDALIEMMAQRIRFRNSAAGQRALMTSSLRNSIKARDGYACRNCSASVAVEPNLLLEIDHIIPVSRGGMSTADNLQTLCWRCNRSKSNKMPA